MVVRRNVPMPMRLALALLVALTVLAAAPAGAGGALTVGVTDDSGLGSADGGTSFVATLRDLGFAENRVTVLWDPDAPATIPNEAALDRLPLSRQREQRACRARRLPGALDRPHRLGQRGLAVHRLPRAARPPLSAGDRRRHRQRAEPAAVLAAPVRRCRPRVGCAAYAGVLAAAYDALKAVNPAITVVGLGLSPRGNDNAQARDNASTSPVRCLRDIGAAYRASKRAKPIMDELSFHAHPENDTQPFGARAAWPKAGLTDLDRIKQAVWDAFNGTAQPTFAEAGRSIVLPTLKLRIAEVGWQVGIVPSAQGSYTGNENMPTTDEAAQAANYVEAVRRSPVTGRPLAALLRPRGRARPGALAGRPGARGRDARGRRTPPSRPRWPRDGSCAGAAAVESRRRRLGGTRITVRKVVPKNFRTWGFSLASRRTRRSSAHSSACRGAVAKQWRSVISRTLAGRRRRDPAGLPAVRSCQGAVRAHGDLPETEAEAGVLRVRPSPGGRDEPGRTSFAMGKVFRLGPLDRTGKTKRKPKPRPKPKVKR